MLKGYSLGQIQTWVTALFAGVLWAWTARRRAVAGTLAGLMCLIKPQYALLLAWAVLRRQWRFAAAGALTLGLGLGASLLLFGWTDNLDYRRVLWFIARHGESFYPNQSLNGLLNRCFGNGFNLRFDSHGFAPFHPTVYLWTTISTVFFSVMALLPVRRGSRAPGGTHVSFVVLSATLASPIAWEHHYGVLLPIYAWLLPVLWSRRRRERWPLVLLAVSYVLASNFFGITRRFALAGPVWTLLQSYLFAGGLLVWILLLRAQLAPEASVAVPMSLPQRRQPIATAGAR
jgi:hypothetical protein